MLICLVLVLAVHMHGAAPSGAELRPWLNTTTTTTN